MLQTCNAMSLLLLAILLGAYMAHVPIHVTFSWIMWLTKISVPCCTIWIV